MVAVNCSKRLRASASPCRLCTAARHTAGSETRNAFFSSGRSGAGPGSCFGATGIQEAKSEWHVVLGTVKNPEHPEARGLSLRRSRFYVPRPEVTEALKIAVPKDPRGIISYSGDLLPHDCWPGNWVVLWMLGWPIGVLTLPLLLVCGPRLGFPFLTLQSRRRQIT